MNYFKELDGSVTSETSHNANRNFMKNPRMMTDTTSVWILNCLNDALASEIVCALRFKKQASMAQAVRANSMAVEFQNLAQNAQVHVDLIAERIIQLESDPIFTPGNRLMKSDPESVETSDLVEMAKEGWVTKRMAIDSYAQMILVTNGTDLATHRMLEKIVASEKEHANILMGLLTSFQPRTPADSAQQFELKTSEDGRHSSSIGSSPSNIGT